MGNFITQLIADSFVRINEKPYFHENGSKSLILELPGVVIALFDRIISYSNLFIPNGLFINVELEAPNIDIAIDRSLNVAIYSLSILSSVSKTSISQPKPFWSYDASPNLEEREYRKFVYDPALTLATRELEQSMLCEVLEKKFNHFLRRDEITSDRKERVQKAISSFRRGLSDNDDILTEFLIHWSSLEILDVVYREVYKVSSKKIYTTCVSCGNEYTDCPICGKKDTFLKTQTLSGVEEIFTRLNQPDKFHDLRRLRTGIIHGFKPLSKSIEEAKNNLDLIRNAVLLMIMRILSVEKNIQEKILGQSAFKGKFTPYIKLCITGIFDPSDVRTLMDHPFVEEKLKDVQAIIDNGKIIFKPSWDFTPRNCKSMSFKSWEIYGDEGAKVEITSVDIK